MPRKLKQHPKPFDDIEALTQAMQEQEACALPDDGGATTLELAARWKISRNKTLKKLAALNAEGKLEVVKVRREQLDGVSRMVTGYKVRA